MVVWTRLVLCVGTVGATIFRTTTETKKTAGKQQNRPKNAAKSAMAFSQDTNLNSKNLKINSRRGKLDVINFKLALLDKTDIRHRIHQPKHDKQI